MKNQNLFCLHDNLFVLKMVFFAFFFIPSNQSIAQISDGHDYHYRGEYQKSIDYFSAVDPKDKHAYLYYYIAENHALLKQADSAFFYLDEAIKRGYNDYYFLSINKDFEYLKQFPRWDKYIGLANKQVDSYSNSILFSYNYDHFIFICTSAGTDGIRYSDRHSKKGWVIDKNIGYNEPFQQEIYGAIKLDRVDTTNWVSTLPGTEFIADEDTFQFTEKYVFIKENGKAYLFDYRVQKANNISFVLINEETSSHLDIDILLKLKNGNFYSPWEKDEIIGHKAPYREIDFDGNSVEEIYYYCNDDEKLYSKNGKLGLKSKNSIIPAIYDSLKISYGFIKAYQNNKEFIFHNYQLLIEKTKSSYVYSQNYVQVIDSLNQMYYIDTLGNRTDRITEKRSLLGNDTESNTFYYKICTNNKAHIIPCDFKKRTEFVSIKYMDALEYDVSILDLVDIAITKYFGVTLTEEQRKIKSYIEDKELKIKSKKNLFVNGELSISCEHYWYDVGFYKPLPATYVIGKSKGKYGIQCFKTDTIILPYEYSSIKVTEPYRYLKIEKGGLYGAYPYTGSVPRYKKLENYIDYYARFKNKSGKTGWVDRTGKEYFD